MRHALTFLMLVGCNGLGDPDLYDLTCDDVECHGEAAEYDDQGEGEWRCWWPCHQDQQLTYVFARAGGCWELKDVREDYCDGDGPACPNFTCFCWLVPGGVRHYFDCD